MYLFALKIISDSDFKYTCQWFTTTLPCYLGQIASNQVIEGLKSMGRDRCTSLSLSLIGAAKTELVVA